MSRENVEIVQNAFQRFQEGGWEAMLGTFWDPEVVWNMRPTGIPGLGVYRGYDEALGFMEEWFSAFPFEDWEQDINEVIDCGDDRVIAVAHQRGRGSASSAAVDLEYAQVITLRDGKIVNFDVYLDRAKAFEAAGVDDPT